MTDKRLTDDLRDARLAQALKHMPDAHMQPGAPTRNAILQQAARVAGAGEGEAGQEPSGAQQRWGQFLFGSPGSRAPWNTAFASVVLVFFVTLLWYEQEAPQPPPQTPVAEPIAPRASADNTVVAERKLSPARQAGPTVASTNPVAPPLAKEAVVASAASPEVLSEAPPVQTVPAAPAEALARPATATPEPAVALATGPAVKSLARADAAPPVVAVEQRSRASLSAGAPVGAVSSVAVTISQGALQQRVSALAAHPLLAMLRALSYAPAAALPKRAEAASDLLVVEVSGQERWVINGNQVSRENAGARSDESQVNPLADAASQAELGNLTPTQASELRRLALEIAASGK